MTAANDRRSTRRRRLAICSIILEQPLDIFELFLRAQRIAETAPQLFDDAAGALHIDLARHLDTEVVGIATVQRAAERIGVALRARLAEPAVGAGALPLPHLLLHGLRQTLRAFAQRIKRAALRLDRAVGIAVAQLGLGVAHRFTGLTELVHAVAALALFALLTLLALTVLAEAAILKFFKQLLEPFAQRLLVLLQVAHGVALLALLTLLALLALLTLLSLLATLAVLAALILTLPESAV